ncbi:polyketide synthase dehydratase domain-containing protein, partial [Streptomyces tirandamycinicus]|uniref:polyketide synthase dehydratase domain-containing protein n=1 Tax=Streptomyces tirandamycinicus TaxID=2174846 RepID=UPI003425416A
AEDEVVPYLSGGVVVAAVNGPSSVVVSGVEEAVLAVAARFEGEGRRVSRLRVSHAFHSPLMEPMLDDFRAVVTGLSLATPRIPVVSNLTGAVASPEDIASAEYWVRHVREAVRFSDGVRALRAEGVTRFLELGPDGVLSAMAAESLPDGEAVLVPLLRKDRPEEQSAVAALARVYTEGGDPDWTAFYAGTDARVTDLPTYAFQHQRFWPEPALTAPADVSTAGLETADHPLLSASTAIELTDGDGLLMTTRLSLAGHAWLADHEVMGSVLLPGTAFVELALHAADEAGCDRIEELTLAAPLVLPGDAGGVQLQLHVGPADESGRRSLTARSRVEGAGERPWVRHATGVLAPTDEPLLTEVTRPDTSVWPPADAEPVDLTGLYERMADGGFVYGPLFQGLRRAWRRGDETYAEVSLPETGEGDADAFGLHPALLDAALHVTAFNGMERGVLPFSWEGVSLHGSGASAVRVRVVRTGDDSVSVAVTDPEGGPVASVESLVLRRVSADQIGTAAPAGGAAGRDSLFRVEWVPVRVPGVVSVVSSVEVGLESDGLLSVAGGVVPGVVVVRLPGAGAGAGGGVGDVVGSVHGLTAGVLGLVQAWLAEERFAGARLVFVTRGATAGVDVAGAAVWGLVRSAQSEHPGRFVLMDLGGDEEVSDVLLSAVVGLDEPQLLVRRGEVLAARLVRAVPDV